MRVDARLSTVDLEHLTSSQLGAQGIYQRYLELLQQDIATFFATDESLISVPCPGCGGSERQEAYLKMGLRLCRCDACQSLYVNPRPSPAALDRFYELSPACRHWRKESFNLPAENKRHLRQPRVGWVAELLDTLEFTPKLLLDYESKSPYLLSCFARELGLDRLYTLRPRLFEWQHLLPEGVAVAQENNLPNQIDVITAFDTLERLSDCDALFQFATRRLRPDGFLFLTTSTCSGFEYQVLGEQAFNLNPINRMNLFSIEALTQRVNAAGFEIIEFSTPGRLDVEV
ncbi:MAG: class I SAM-dependent methyltransferase, partial [Magnetococcales bacterium]|nr:class I SAM-dependent methyltransferase [Magnetococcales bacterium]